MLGREAIAELRRLVPVVAGRDGEAVVGRGVEAGVCRVMCRGGIAVSLRVVVSAVTLVGGAGATLGGEAGATLGGVAGVSGTSAAASKSVSSCCKADKVSGFKPGNGVAGAGWRKAWTSSRADWIAISVLDVAGMST